MDFWKFSNLDAYSNNEKTGRKLTYQRLVEIRESNIDELNKIISNNESHLQIPKNNPQFKLN